MRYLLPLFLFGLLSVCAHPVLAQTPSKFEKESRIKRSDVPSQALAFIDSLALPGRIKWYREQGLDKHSIEAKFNHARRKFSVEFDSSGRIEDVEVEIPWSAIASERQIKMQAGLKGDCEKYLIDKIQAQYIGPSEDLRNIILNFSSTERPSARYELIVRCKRGLKTTLFEYLFETDGTVLQVTEIILKPSSHLEY